MKSVYAKKKTIWTIFLITFLIPFILITVSWIYISTTLPSSMAISAYEPSLGTKVYDINDELIYEFAKEKRIILESDEVPEIFKKTLIAVEDRRFYKHSAIDLFGIFRALMIDIYKGKIVQGASTITQQLARNMYLSHETTIIRKIKEAILAFKIEFSFSKEEILTKYLNVVYFGNGAYGIGAAANVYFDKTVDELNIGEVALIIALAKGSKYSPYQNPKLAVSRRNLVLRNLYDTGYITQKQYQKNINKDIQVSVKKSSFNKLAPYFVTVIRKRLIKEYGSKVLYQGGLKVYTTLDPELQKLANKASEINLKAISERNDYEPRKLKDINNLKEDLERTMIFEGEVKDITDSNIIVDLGRGFKGLISIKREDWTWDVDPKKHFEIGEKINVKYYWANFDKKIMGVSWERKPFPQIAMVAMNPKNGYVNALIGGADYKESQYNRAVGTTLQIGSLIKPFYYAAAIDSKRFTMASGFVDSPYVWQLPNQNPSSWKPKNYGDDFKGKMTLRRAIAKSINVVSAKLLEQIGPQTAVDFMHKLGIESDVPAVPSLSVGIAELSPFEVARTYCTFANMGKRVKPIFIRKIHNREDELIVEHKPETVRVISKQTAFIMLEMIKAVYEPGGTTGFIKSKLGVEGIVAGKSGTTDNAADLWLTSILPYKVITGWMGFDYKTSLGKNEYGSKAHAEGFAYILKDIMEDRKYEDWKRPPGLVKKRVDPKNGKLIKQKKEEVIKNLDNIGDIKDINDEKKDDKEDSKGVEMYFYKGTAPTIYEKNDKKEKSVDFSDF